MHKPRPSRTRYRKTPRRFFEDEDMGPDEREDPINGPGETESK